MEAGLHGSKLEPEAPAFQRDRLCLLTAASRSSGATTAVSTEFGTKSLSSKVSSSTTWPPRTGLHAGLLNLEVRVWHGFKCVCWVNPILSWDPKLPLLRGV